MRPLSNAEKRDLKQLVLPFVNDLHRMALSLCRDPATSEDLVAETVATACESFRSLKDKKRTKQWLFRILTNKFISQYRFNKRHPEITYVEGTEDDGESFSLYEQVSQPFLLWWGNPERELVANLMAKDIQTAIESLPPEFRVVVVLCDVEGLSYEDIAAVLEIPVGTVRSRIARGRSQLQKKLWHHAQDLGLIKTYRHNRGNHEQAEEIRQGHQL